MSNFTASDCLDVQFFEKYRDDIFNFVKNIDQDVDFQSKPFYHLLVNAPVKSGKREIMIVFQLRNNPGTGRKVKHYYLSALNRKDDKPQLEELAAYGFGIFLSSAGQSLVDEIAGLDSEYDKFMIHFNESDYGTGSGQLTSKFFNHLITNPKVQIIAYSATNEEAENSKFAKKYHCKIATFMPPDIYCGTKWYLDNNRVRDAQPFWDEESGTLTGQGIECCNLLKNSSKVFGVIRFPRSISEIKESGKLATKLKTLYGFRVQFVDAKESFDWGKNGDWYKALGIFSDTGIQTILVICQTATRSTELKFHRHIRFWHGAERKAAYNTIIQADGRVIFYDTPENNPPKNPVDIIVYSSVRAFRLNADYTTTQDYGKKLSGRMSVKVNKAGTKTRLKIVWADTKPSLDQFNALAKSHGAFCEYTEPFNRTISGTNYLDMASGILQPEPVLMGRINKGIRAACTVHFDSANNNFLNTWELVKNAGVVGKYAIALEIDEDVVEGAIHATTRRSMFEVV